MASKTVSFSFNEDTINKLSSTFLGTISNYIFNNYQSIKNLLTGGNRLLLDSAKKTKTIKPEFASKIFNSLDKEEKLVLLSKITGSLFTRKQVSCEEDHLIIDEEAITELFAADKNKKKDEIKKYFEIFNYDYSLVEKDAGLLKKNKEQSKVAELEQKIDELKENIKESEKKHKSELNKATTALDAQKTKLKDKEETITKLTKDINKLNNDNKGLEKTIESLKSEIESLKTNVSADIEIKNDNEEEDEKYVDNKSIISDLENRYILGMVRPENIDVEFRNWIIINPLVPIIEDVPIFSQEKFSKDVDYRGPYSTFICKIDVDLISTIMPEQSSLFMYIGNNEKYRLLADRLSYKTIIFKPSLVTIGNRVKMNAKIVEIIDSTDFNNSQFIPKLSISLKDFEKAIKNKDDLIVRNYPASIFTSLQYVCVENSVYLVDYMPSYSDSNQDLTTWKMNSEVKTKLNINIDNTNEAFLSVGQDEMSGLYFKKTALVQYLSIKNKETSFDENSFIDKVMELASSSNLIYTIDEIKNFHIALKSSNIVILAGPSGIGKTRLPLIYSAALGLSEQNGSVLFVPISPSYLEPEDVIGYVRPVSEKQIQNDSENKINENDDDNKDTKSTYPYEFIESKSGLVSFLNDASINQDKIHIVLFDEMNLSQIEHWFAPFISVLEKDVGQRELVLYSNSVNVINRNNYPSKISIGNNVFFVGTVNIDETTKSISDRLLDRSIVIKLSKSSFKDLKKMEVKEKTIAQEIKFSTFQTKINQNNNYIAKFNDEEVELLQEIDNLLLSSLSKKGISFRTAKKISNYLSNSANLMDRKVALDYAMVQMVIDRLSGTIDELDDVITEDQSKGLISILNSHPNLSDFKISRKCLDNKFKELTNYGYTK